MLPTFCSLTPYNEICLFKKYSFNKDIFKTKPALNISPYVIYKILVVFYTLC